MRTAVISDLHLGTIVCADLARDPELCMTLLDELGDAYVESVEAGSVKWTMRPERWWSVDYAKL